MFNVIISHFCFAEYCPGVRVCVCVCVSVHYLYVVTFIVIIWFSS